MGHDLPEYERLVKEGWHKIDDPSEPTIMLKQFRDDPVRNALATPSGKIEIFQKQCLISDTMTVRDIQYGVSPMNGLAVTTNPIRFT